ncbi:MAG TPA: arginine repressor [Planctomycetota bacterium]|jgi:transcriptional regulator of arginine metabolism|nr:arginine repressor [Planctomycetota bacterium]
MSTKAERQKALLDIIAKQAVSTQAELKDLLKERGIEADQATLSRDIRELGLIKASDDGAHYRYAPVEAVQPPVHTKASAILARLVRKIDCSGNLLVIKTDPGEASPIGLALDRMGWSEVVGTVAGDDTLLVVVKEGSPARKLAKRILDLKSHQKSSA